MEESSPLYEELDYRSKSIDLLLTNVRYGVNCDQLLKYSITKLPVSFETQCDMNLLGDTPDCFAITSYADPDAAK